HGRDDAQIEQENILAIVGLSDARSLNGQPPSGGIGGAHGTAGPLDCLGRGLFLGLVHWRQIAQSYSRAAGPRYPAIILERGEGRFLLDTHERLSQAASAALGGFLVNTGALEFLHQTLFFAQLLETAQHLLDRL